MGDRSQHDTEKENIQPRSPSVTKTKQSSREFPSTPAGRVPLSDLIGNQEEYRDKSPRGSPYEAVSWNKSPKSSDQAQSFMTPMVNRKRKRPRSSSAGASKTESKILDIADIPVNTKTPRNDPAFELESRYFGHKYRTPSKPASSAAPDLMHSSSPQTPAPAAVDSAKLKRTRSCGMAYPSGHKRRKVEEKLDFRLVLPESETSSGRKDGEMQQISLLLDSIHEDLPGSLRISQLSPPPASLPPSRRVIQGSQNTLRAATSSQRGLGQRDSNIDAKRAAVSPRISQESNKSGRSDYSELDLDLEDLTEKEIVALSVPIGSTKLESPQLPGTELSKHSSITRDVKVVGKLTTGHVFDDDDDDAFDEFVDEEELEILASMCDPAVTQIPPQAPSAVHPLKIAQLPSPSLEVHEKENRAGAAVIELSDDEFNDGIDDDFCEDLFAATQAPEDEHPKTKTAPTLQRYIIVSVSDSTFQTETGSARPEKILQLEDVKTRSLNKVAVLRGSWIDGIYPESCIVHVLGHFDSKGHCIIDDKKNWLIIHPDHLVSATVVADSFGCIRRAVLQDRVKATSGSTEPLVYGHILHEVFQESMKVNRWDNEWIETTITNVCSRYLENLYEINIELPLAIHNLMTKATGLQAWADIFVSNKPKPDAKVSDRGRGNVLMSINKLLEVEEHIWSPKFGLKGNIDATIQVVMSEDNQERTLTVPLELKTGRNTSNVSHQAQTALYTLLLSDRYDVEVTYGILFYLESSATSRITGVRNEIASMIQQRNKIATYVRNRETLPPMLQDARMCGRCYAKTSCFVYHRLVEDGDGKTSGLKEEFVRLVNHLKPAHKEFFMKWDSLLSKEETDAYRFRKELWTMTSSEREKVGRCFGGLVIDNNLSEEMADAPKINRYRYTLVKQQAVSKFSFTESQITVGEPIVISDESGHYALANGYVLSVRPHRITVLVDRRLSNVRTRSKNFDALTNQNFSGIMRVPDGAQGTTSQDFGETVIYRLDKDEFSNGMATVRNNLIRLMDSDAYGSDALRQLIVELKPPAFQTPRTGKSDNLESEQSLNVDQRNAVEKVMSAKNYALVLGMPGTGKTTTIAHIIRALVAEGKSVLLTSYTHTAVDNILLKIRNDNISILRLGATAKVHPEVQAFVDLANEPKKSFEDLQKSYSAQVVATTCLGVNHAIFNTRIFDYCIVDEASQITLPVCLGPIAMAKKFVLVGDHYQLPPLVQNKEALEGGLDISLFKLLSDSHPDSVVNLEHQYRMCEDIMSLSNALIYSGRLKCGTPEVAASEMSIPNMSALKLHHHTADTLAQEQSSFCSGPNQGSCWLRDTLDPFQRVVFLNTDSVGLGAQEIVSGTRISNPFEVTIATQTVEALLAVGIPAVDIGVITLYRSQLALLKHSLRHRSPSSYANPTTAAVEMHTADKFQGRDKEVVVLSLVRSNDNGTIGDLLQDWRRVNVALTRARTKLIIIGSLNTISQGNELLNKFCTMCSERGWVYNLREGAGQAHYFDEWRTQTQGLLSTKANNEDNVDAKDLDSDFEIGSSGKSPKKASPKKKQPLTGVNKPFKQVKFAPKSGTTNARRLLSNRVVLGDIINDVMGSKDDS